MGNIRNGNTFYIDTQYSAASDELLIQGVRVPYVIVSASSSANQVILVDSVTGAKKLNLQNMNSSANLGDSRIFDFKANPLLFPNGIRPLTLSNCIVTCVIIDPRG